MMENVSVDPRDIREFDMVELTDGREATIVFVPKDPTTGFEVDIGSGPEDWDTISIKASQIKRVVWHAEQRVFLLP